MECDYCDGKGHHWRGKSGTRKRCHKCCGTGSIDEPSEVSSTDWLSVGESLGRAKDGLQEILCAIRLPQNREQFIKNNWGVLVDMADRLWEENFSDNTMLKGGTE